MNRGELIVYLTQNECYPDDECDSDVAQLWHNAINGEAVFVPYVDELTLITYCHIFSQLKVIPPLEYESDYEIYDSFRKHSLLAVRKDVEDID